MTPELMNGIIQGGALVLLALVLRGISKKVDAVLIMAEAVEPLNIRGCYLLT
jgi:hypothetical protein